MSLAVRLQLPNGLKGELPGVRALQKLPPPLSNKRGDRYTKIERAHEHRKPGRCWCGLLGDWNITPQAQATPFDLALQVVKAQGCNPVDRLVRIVDLNTGQQYFWPMPISNARRVLELLKKSMETT